MYDSPHCGDSGDSTDASAPGVSKPTPQLTFYTASCILPISLTKETLEDPAKFDSMSRECYDFNQMKEDGLDNCNCTDTDSKAEGDSGAPETVCLSSCASNLPLNPVENSDMGRYISEDKPSASANEIPSNTQEKNILSESDSLGGGQHETKPLKIADRHMKDPSLDANEMEIPCPGGAADDFDSRCDNDWSRCRDPSPIVNEGEKIGELCENDQELHLFTGVLTLDQLDDDVLFLIASFLEARVVRFALIHVCKRFQVMFENEAYWRARINVRWPKRYPAVPSPLDFKWVDACVEREDSNRVWTDVMNNTRHFMYSCNVFGEVDSVHLMKEGQLVASGDRNRSLNFIDLAKYPGPSADETQLKDMLVHSNTNMHEGWIWSIASNRSHVITGSWDTKIRLFDLGAGCNLVSHFRCKSAVLSLYAEENEIVASCFDRKIYFIDCRSTEVKSRLVHTKPVLCLTGNDKYIVSGSEDRSICIFDRRANKIFMMFKGLDSYPLCMSYVDNQLWFGDKTGTLHLHDGTDGIFQHVGSYDVGHTEKMTGVIGTRGAIFTCSGDKSIKVLHPTQEPDPICSLNVHRKEIANIDYKNGVLVSAGGDDCIGVWLPKHWERNTHLL